MLRTTDAGQSAKFVEGYLLAWRQSERRRPALVRLLRTRDGGQTWRSVGPPTSRPLWRLLDLGGDRVLFGGAGIWRSGDGGRTLRRIGNRRLREASVAGFDRAGPAVIAYGEKLLARSRDGGRRWRRIALPRRPEVTDADFLTPRRGFLVSRRRLYVTRNGGRTWNEARAVRRHGPQGVSFGDRRHGFVDASVPEDSDVGPDEVIDPGFARLLRTEDGGRTWRLQPLLYGIPVTDVAALGRGGGLLSLGSSLLWTESGGGR